MSVEFFCGDTFSFVRQIDASYKDANGDTITITDFTGWSGEVVAVTREGTPIAGIVFAWVDASLRLAHANYSGDTSAWPVGVCLVRFRLTSPDSQVVSTPNIEFLFKRGS